MVPDKVSGQVGARSLTQKGKSVRRSALNDGSASRRSIFFGASGLAPRLYYELSVRCFQTCEQRRPSPQLLGQRFDRAQSGGADMMFHPFNVVINDSIIETEKFEEIG